MTTQFARVLAPSRLHMGFVDVSGVAGRRFGSLGLTLDSMATQVEVRPGASKLLIDGPERAAGLVSRYLSATGDSDQLQVSVDQRAPAHAGFGTGTQLALALGAAIDAVHGRPVNAREIAATFGRGARSGIGVGAFEQGGFIVDGGRGPNNAVPPVTARLDFPQAWRVLLVIDTDTVGLSGDAEREAFNQLPAFPVAEAHRMAHLILVQCLPALVETDLPAFGRVITEIQQLVGDYFAPVQGDRFTSASVGKALAWLADAGATGIGQSSWGPTGFAFVESQSAAQQIATRFDAHWGQSLPGVRLEICQARNQGAQLSFQ